VEEKEKVEVEGRSDAIILARCKATTGTPSFFFLLFFPLVLSFQIAIIIVISVKKRLHTAEETKKMEKEEKKREKQRRKKEKRKGILKSIEIGPIVVLLCR